MTAKRSVTILAAIIAVVFGGTALVAKNMSPKSGGAHQNHNCYQAANGQVRCH